MMDNVMTLTAKTIQYHVKHMPAKKSKQIVK